MMRSVEPAPILVSGASAAPTLRLQRLRARMMLRKRLTLSATPAGGLLASTSSKWRRASRSLLLEEEGAGELEPDTDQPGALDEDRAELGDRLVEKLVALLGLGAGGLVDGQHAQPEADGGLVLGERGAAQGEDYQDDREYAHGRSEKERPGPRGAGADALRRGGPGVGAGSGAGGEPRSSRPAPVPDGAATGAPKTSDHRGPGAGSGRVVRGFERAGDPVAVVGYRPAVGRLE